jgi:hypothetical protein
MIWRVLTDADTEASAVAAGTWLMNLAGLTAPATAARDTGQEGCPPGADAGEAGWQGDPGRERR